MAADTSAGATSKPRYEKAKTGWGYWVYSAAGNPVALFATEGAAKAWVREMLSKRKNREAQ